MLPSDTHTQLNVKTKVVDLPHSVSFVFYKQHAVGAPYMLLAEWEGLST